MNQERKVSVLRNLLDRVQRRATAPRVVASPVGGPMAASAFSAAAGSAAPAGGLVGSPAMPISAPPAQPATSARPGSSTLPLDFGSRGESASVRGGADAFSERPAPDRASASGAGALGGGAASAPGGSISDAGPISAPEDEEGPPSAPRLREVPEEETPAEERDRDEEEPQLKTPPPESGRQHVTPGPAPTISEADEDISITVTMEESEVPPSVSEREPESAPMPMSAGSRQEIPDLSGPQPRLALVSEPEIELHGMTPISSDVGIAVPVASPAPAVPAATPSGVRPTAQPIAAPPAPPPAPGFSRTAPSVVDTRPSVGMSPPVGPAAPSPPVRLMAQPLGDASGKPLPPVEVWASTFTPAALRGQVASFVGQNANFEPKTFGELVRASIALGEDKT